MSRFILYGTLGCHLCEVAEAQLSTLLAEPFLQQTKVEIECIDISEDDTLLANYAERIPVLRRMADNAELDWPFQEPMLRELLTQILM